MANEFLLMKLDDKTRKVAEEIVKDLPEGMAQIVTWSDLENVVMEAHRQTPEFLRLTQHEALGYIPEPNYDEIAEAARETWHRPPRAPHRRIRQKSPMFFSRSKLGA